MAMKTDKGGRESSVGLFDELLLLSKRQFAHGRRSERRYPLFFAASVQVGQHSYSVFTRDISDTGIGLLHNMDLPLQEILLTIPNQSQRLRLRLEWCQLVGEGWYISGGTRTDSIA